MHLCKRQEHKCKRGKDTADCVVKYRLLFLIDTCKFANDEAKMTQLPFPVCTTACFLHFFVFHSKYSCIECKNVKTDYKYFNLLIIYIQFSVVNDKFYKLTFRIMLIVFNLSPAN